MLGENRQTSNVRISVFVVLGTSKFAKSTNIGKYHLVKISSPNYVSVYARTSENVDKYPVFAYSRPFSEN